MQNRMESALRLAFVPLVAVQLSCGDPSGPSSVATTMNANSATTITASPGATVTERPSVIVFDQNGAPMAGVAVTFSASGGGIVTGGSQVTDAQGIATVGGWTLGSTPGSYTVVASSSGLPSITFTATASDPCLTVTNMAFGTTVTGTLSTTDCTLSDGSYIDFFQVTVPSAGTYLFSQSSSAFDTYLFLFSGTGALIAFNDDISSSNLNSAVKAILPAGTFRLGANSFDGGRTGNYTLSSAASTAGITNCEVVWGARGMNTAQQLQTSDCAPQSSGSFDNYFIFLNSGESMTITMSSGTINCLLELYSSATNRVAVSQCSGGSAALTFTATSAAIFAIRAGSVSSGATGSYTLMVQ